MAEIKSAIELAMERTRSLVMSEEEKIAQAGKELEGKIRVLVRRHCEEMLDKEDVEKEFSKLEADPAQLRSLLIDVIVEQLDFREDNTRILELLDLAGSGLEDSMRQELETLKKRYTEDLERKELIIRERIRQELDGSGLSGDALDLNIEAWPQWKEGLEETRRVFVKRLGDWKTRLKAAKG